MYSDINSLHESYNEFLMKNKRYSELSRLYDETHWRSKGLQKSLVNDIHLIREKMKRMDWMRHEVSLHSELMLKEQELKEISTASKSKSIPIYRRKTQLEKKLRPEFFKQLNHLTDHQLAIITDSIETAEKPTRIHGVNTTASDEWWDFVSDYRRWAVNKDVFNQSKKVTPIQVLVGLVLLIIIVCVIKALP